MRAVSRWIGVAVCVLLVGCEAGPTGIDPAPTPRLDVGITFNPQPEPPAYIAQFEAAGRPEGRWVGSFRDPETGRTGLLTVDPVMVSKRGRTLVLQQTWTFVPPEPVHPPEPGIVSLRGILNLATGKLVLNGSDAVGGPAHVQGTAEFSTAGGLSVGGEVMFNPQPEPPAR